MRGHRLSLAAALPKACRRGSLTRDEPRATTKLVSTRYTVCPVCLPAVPLACQIGRTLRVLSGQPRSLLLDRRAGRLSVLLLERIR
jgi:hypothetical protein